jgi:hypothetical protein
MEATDQVLQPGTVVSVQFRAPQFSDLAALQCALRFNPEQLSLLNAEPLQALPLAADNFGLYEVSEGVVRVVWAQATGVGVEEAAPVFQLDFLVLQGGSLLSEVLVLDNEILAASATNVALTEIPLYLQYTSTTGTGHVADRRVLRLHQNIPNPFRDRTAIGFELPDACDVALRIFDASGRLLSERTGFYAAGKHAETFDDRFMPGILYYELSTPFGKLTERMVVME